MDTAFEKRVRERAYEIWMASGMQSGSEDLHWLCAEQAVMSEGNKACAKVAKPAKATKPAAATKPAVSGKPTIAALKSKMKNDAPSVIKSATPRKSAKAAASASA